MPANQPTPEEFENFLNQRNLPEYLENWINENQLIEFLNVSRNTLRNWRYQRKVLHSKFNSVTLYDAEDILRKLEKAAKKKRK